MYIELVLIDYVDPSQRWSLLELPEMLSVRAVSTKGRNKDSRDCQLCSLNQWRKRREFSARIAAKSNPITMEPKCFILSGIRDWYGDFPLWVHNLQTSPQSCSLAVKCIWIGKTLVPMFFCQNLIEYMFCPLAVLMAIWYESKSISSGPSLGDCSTQTNVAYIN